MRVLIAIIVVFGLLFFSRSSAGRQFFGSVVSLWQTGSGAVQQVGEGVKGAIDAGKTGVQAVGEGVREIQQRTDQLKRGVQELQSGSALLQQGLRNLSGN